MSHGAGDLLDVVRLALNGNTGDSGQINKGQVRTGVREHLKHDGLIDNVFVGAADLVGESNDILTHFFENCEFLTGDFIREHSVRLNTLIHMVQAKFERTTRHDTITTRQEVETDNGFEHRRLTSGLGS